MNDDISPELEAFRQQWREEVRARNQGVGGEVSGAAAASSSATTSRQVRAPGPPVQAIASGKTSKLDDEEGVPARNFDEPETSVPSPRSQGDSGRGKSTEPAQPVTALEHYEEAVETEGQGNLGEALRLYRKAFRVSIPAACLLTPGPVRIRE